MNVRLLLAISLCVVALGLDLLVVAHEARREPRAVVAVPPPTLPPTWGQSYGPGQRRAVLEAVGARGEVLDGALRRAGILLARRAELEHALGRVEDAELVAETLCSDTLPVFYRAALLLLDGRSGEVRVVSPLGAGFGERAWDGATGAEIAALYTIWELHPMRQDADAQLALAALVLGRVADAAGEVRRGAWQERAARGNSLDRLAEVHGGAPRLLAEYLGTAVALAEVVAASPAAWGCTEAR